MSGMFLAFSKHKKDEKEDGDCCDERKKVEDVTICAVLRSVTPMV